MNEVHVYIHICEVGFDQFQAKKRISNKKVHSPGVCGVCFLSVCQRKRISREDKEERHLERTDNADFGC